MCCFFELSLSVSICYDNFFRKKSYHRIYLLEVSTKHSYSDFPWQIKKTTTPPLPPHTYFKERLLIYYVIFFKLCLTSTTRVE